MIPLYSAGSLNPFHVEREGYVYKDGVLQNPNHERKVVLNERVAGRSDMNGAPSKGLPLDELNAIGHVLGSVVSSRKGSIGSIGNVYLPQTYVKHGDA